MDQFDFPHFNDDWFFDDEDDGEIPFADTENVEDYEDLKEDV